MQLVAVATVACGMAAADTIIAGAIDTTHGEYSVWVKEDGTASTTYFANEIEIELSSGYGTLRRGVLCSELFTDISFDADGQKVSVPSQINPTSTGAVLERIATTQPLNQAVTAATQGPDPQLAALYRPVRPEASRPAIAAKERRR